MRAVVLAGTNVYIGGDFTTVGTVSAYHVAKWDGATWSSLGSGLDRGTNNNPVFALAVASNGDLYAAGTFSQAGGVAANRIAKWNGTTWSSLGTGLGNSFNNSVYALAVASNGDVYAGGYFWAAGGVTTLGIARWNGTAWSSLGTGVSGTVHSLAIGPTGKIYAGGAFTSTGDHSKAMAYFGIYDPYAPLATTSATRAAPAALFPNPAYGAATLRLPAGAPRLPITLTDALGRVVRRYPAPVSPDAALDLRGLPAGVYAVGCGHFTQRLVVE